MARIFRLWLDLHEPTNYNPNTCVETYEKVRTATPNRILHFGYPKPVTQDDVDYLCDVIAAQITSCISRTIGIAAPLDY